MNRRTLIFNPACTLNCLFSILFLEPPGEGIIPDGAEEVKLYFSTKDAMYLKAETRKIEAGKTNKYVETINELIKGPVSKELNRTIPEGVRIRELRIDVEYSLSGFLTRLWLIITRAAVLARL